MITVAFYGTMAMNCSLNVSTTMVPEILSGLNSNCLTSYKGQGSLIEREGQMAEDRSEKGRVTPHVSHLVHTVLPGEFCSNTTSNIFASNNIHTIRKETHTATCKLVTLWCVTHRATWQKRLK